MVTVTNTSIQCGSQRGTRGGGAHRRSKADTHVNRYGCHIGRVGALAVALGVGVAVASTPGVAWADDIGSASSEGTTGTAGATGTGGTSDSEGTSTTVGTTAGPTGPSTVQGSPRTAPPRRGLVRWTLLSRAPPRRRTRRCGRCHRGWCMPPVARTRRRKSSSETSAKGDVTAEVDHR